MSCLFIYLFIDRSAIVWKQEVSVNLCSGPLFGSCISSLVQKCGFKLRHHDVLNVQSFAKSVSGRDFKGEDPGKKPVFRIPCVIRNL